MLPTWENRPITVAHILNPAFCGEILSRCTINYQLTRIDKNYMPLQLTFIVLPLVLHKTIREALPRSNKNLFTWLDENQSIKMQIPTLIKSMVPYTKETIMFLMMYKIVRINEMGQVEILKKLKTRKIDGEISECYKKSESVGRWLANSGNSQFIFSTFGIKP